MTTCNAQNDYDSSRHCTNDAPHHGEPHDDGLGAWDRDGNDVGNDVHTRRLIVTLPIASGEEADSVAEMIDSEVLTDGFTNHGTVTHALGATLPDGLRCYVTGAADVVIVITQTRTGQPDDMILLPDADEARQLAGRLLTLAHSIDGK